MPTPAEYIRAYPNGPPSWQPPPQSTPAPTGMPPPMRSPMAAKPSPFNHSYGGGLADIPQRPVGRSIDDPARQNERLNRIARQHYGQTGDPSLMLQMNWRNRSYPPPGLTPGSPMMVPGANPEPRTENTEPRGHWVPGFNGSQMFIKDAPQQPVPGASFMVPGSNQAPLTPAEPPLMTAAGTPGGFQFQPLPAARLPRQPVGFAERELPPLPPFNKESRVHNRLDISRFMPAVAYEAQGQLDITKPLPPSTLGGGTGVPVPYVDPKNPLPLIPSPAEVKAFGLQPDYSKPQEWGGKQYPTFKTPKAEETSPWQLYDAPGPMVPHPYIKDQMIPGPPIKRQVNPITGETRDLIPEGTQRGAAAPAAPTSDSQAPSWKTWLDKKLKK